jgi:hypothetical protein
LQVQRFNPDRINIAGRVLQLLIIPDPGELKGFRYKDWNAQQKLIQPALKAPEEFSAAIDLVLQQHA